MLLLLIGSVALWPLAVAAETDEETEAESQPSAATFWGGWGTNGHIEDIPGIDSDFENTWFAALGLSRRFARTGRHFTWEVEGMVAKHFGWQTHVEGTLALLVRWDGFPWSERVPTSFAVGEGVSWASRVPAMEAALQGVESKLMNYLAFEIDVALPDSPATHLALRLHHRSGAYGLFNGETAGSNFIALGLRRRF